MNDVLERTESLCPVCLRVLPAEILRRGEEALICRSCPDHGLFQEVVWRGPPDFAAWRRPKSPAAGLVPLRLRGRGCPFDCGLCPEHGQHPCTVLLEITGRCNLFCPVCFAGAGGSVARDIPLEDLLENLRWIRAQAGDVVLQISGGEPTLHPRLEDVVVRAAALFPAVQLNTNGLRLAGEPGLARRLRQAGLSWVFLQFDGVSDRVFTRLRGRPLLEKKLAVLDACTQAELPVVLVPTVAAGINDGELGDLVRLAAGTPIVRGIHLQPMTLSGRNPFDPGQARLTLPEVLARLEQLSGGLVRAAEAVPPGCEHERCSFHLRYRRSVEGQLIPRPGAEAACGPGCACSSPEETAENRKRAVDVLIASWQGGRETGKSSGHEDAFERFLEEARRESFSITCMAFQDVWTMDLARLRGCCVQVFQAPDRLVPFCAMNLTAADGTPLYRRIAL